MENAAKKLIDQAAHWDGYLEKKSNAQLDDFTANAGSGNFTCFARDYKTHTGPEPAGPALVRHVRIRGICAGIWSGGG
ncbi:MAG: hypothetical protein ACLSEY_02965 [Enterocloster sp.]